MSRPFKCKYCQEDFVKSDSDDTMKVICPVCGKDYCNKSKTERNLFLLQELYLLKKINKDTLIIRMYPTMLSYTSALILQHFRNRLQDSDDVEDYAQQAVHYFFTYYLQDDNFYVADSFSGLVFHKIRQAINEKSNHACAEFSLNYEFDDGSTIQFEDVVCNDSLEIEKYENKLQLLKYVIQLIFQYEGECNSQRENFLRLQAIHHYLVYGEKRVDMLFRQYGRYGKNKHDETLELLHIELKKLYKEV